MKTLETLGRKAKRGDLAFLKTVGVVDKLGTTIVMSKFCIGLNNIFVFETGRFFRVADYTAHLYVD